MIVDDQRRLRRACRFHPRCGRYTDSVDPAASVAVEHDRRILVRLLYQREVGGDTLPIALADYVKGGICDLGEGEVDQIERAAARKWADGPLKGSRKVTGRAKGCPGAKIEAAYESGEIGGSPIRGIVKVNRVSSDVELTASSPPCAFAIWEAM